jgi:hypothetical protein
VGKAVTDDGADPGEARMATTSSASRRGAAAGASSDGALAVFKHLLPTCLRLAVDSEPVTQQLFAPLSLQIVRLFSARDDMPEAAAVVVAGAAHRASSWAAVFRAH